MKADLGILLEDGKGLYASIGAAQFKSQALVTIAEKVVEAGISDEDVIRIWNAGLKVLSLSDSLRLSLSEIQTRHVYRGLRTLLSALKSI